METKSWAIFLVVICTLFTSVGSLFFKYSVMNFNFTIIGIITNYYLILGLFFYFFGFLLLTWAFKHGEMSVLFPIVSLSFMWVAIASFVFLGEPVNTLRVVGVLFIIGGVVVLGSASKNNREFQKRKRKRKKIRGMSRE